MLRRITTLLSVAVLGLFSAGLTASAESLYPPTNTVTVNISGGNISVVDGNITVVIGETFTFSGNGFNAGESIEILVGSASGLRSTLGLKAVAAAPDVTADGNGSFATPISLEQLGTTTLTAVGASSGRSASLTITVVAAGSAAGGLVAAVGTGTAAVAASGADDGLASTGARLAGPLAIGFIALLAGLSLLYSGTRGVRRRRNADAQW